MPDTDAFTGAFHPHMIRYHPIKITSGHWDVSFTCQKARLK